MRRLIDELEDLWTLSLSSEELEREQQIAGATRRDQLARIQRLESALTAFDQLLAGRRQRLEDTRPSTFAGRFDLIQTLEREVGF